MTGGGRRRAGRWRRTRHSLGARLIALFLVLALGVTVIFIAGSQAALHFGWQGYVRPLVSNYVDLLAERIGTPPSVARARELADHLPLRIRIEGPVVNWTSTPEQDAPDHWRERGVDRPASPWRPVRRLADGHTIRFGLVNMMRDETPEDRPRLIGWATLAALLLLTALAYAVVRGLLRPLVDIRRGAIRYGRGDFSQPIVPRRHDELGDLAQQINRMAEGLHRLLDAKRQLLLAISHELRSPLTRARVNAELVDEGAPRDALLHDLAEMRDLIDDLLESERLTDGHATLRLEPTDPRALIEDLIASQFAGRGIRTSAAGGLPEVPLDRSRIRLLLRNLLDNALRHSVDADLPPGITTERVGDELRIVVRDHGPGIAEDQLAQLAQPFYRPDSARQRSTGGVGLGLYLSRLVAEAHGGSLTIVNARPGLAVEVRLPVSA